MSDIAERLLDAIALSDDGLSTHQLAVLTKSDTLRGIAPRLRAMLKEHGAERSGDRWCLPQPHREQRVRSLWRAGRLLEVNQSVEEVTHWGGHLRRLRVGLLTGDDEAVTKFLGFDGIDVRAWFRHPAEPDLFEALGPTSRRLVTRQLLQDSLFSGDDVLATIEPWADDDVAAEIAFLRGDLSLGTDDFAEGARRLFAGDPKAATKAFASAMKAERAQFGANHVPLSAQSLFCVPAYILSGQKSRTKQAATLIRRAADWTHPSMPYNGWSHLARLLDPRAEADPAEHPFAVYMEMLVACWQGVEPPDTAPAIARARALGWTLFADELEAGSRGRLAGLRETRPAWLDAIAAVERALGTPAKKTHNDQAKHRIAWFLDSEGTRFDLEPRRQTRHGQTFSPGRTISLQRIHNQDEKLPWTPADRAVASALRKRTWRGWSGYMEHEFDWDPAKVWPALVGHPALFDANRESITVVAGEPRLVVSQRGDEAVLQLVPAMEPGGVHVERVGNGFVIYKLDSRQAEVARAIQDALRVPKSERDRLDALIQRAQPTFPQSGPAATEVLEGDPRIGAWLTPRGTTVALELAVAPAGESGPRFEPGMGEPLVLVNVDGRGARYRRDLAAESAWLDAALDLPGVEDTVTVFPSVEETLDFLAAAHACELPVFWPEGGALTVRKGEALSVSVKSAREWFEATGTLTVDDATRIDLAALIELVLRDGGKRFLRLDDGSFLELQAKLRRNLQALARVGHRSRGGVRMHPLASLALEPLDAKKTPAVAKQLQRLTSPPAPTSIPATLRAELRPYQEDAFHWAASLGDIDAGAILADDMGLGKTVTALAVLLRRRDRGPALVVAPTSVAGNWMREAARFAPGLRTIRLRESPEHAPVANDLVVCSYGLLVTRIDKLKDTHWSTVVFDESQALKNPQTQRHRAAHELQAAFRMALTGTPIENHLGELHAQLDIVIPGLLGSRKQFGARFAGPIESGDREARKALKRVVSPFLLRRTKEAVLDELPARTDTELRIELTAAEVAIYEAQRTRALEELDDGATAIDVLAQLTRLRLTACSPALVEASFPHEASKTRAFRQLARDLVAGGHRALVFSQFIGHLKLLRDALDAEGFAHCTLDGSTPARERDRLVDSFQRGDMPFFLISLRAGGTGLNLTAADYVLHMDPWWNPAVEDQASDRAHRIGQRRPVTVYRVIARGTIEEQIVDLHRKKRDLAEHILDGSDTVTRLSAADLLELLR